MRCAQNATDLWTATALSRLQRSQTRLMQKSLARHFRELFETYIFRTSYPFFTTWTRKTLSCFSVSEMTYYLCVEWDVKPTHSLTLFQARRFACILNCTASLSDVILSLRPNKVNNDNCCFLRRKTETIDTANFHFITLSYDKTNVPWRLLLISEIYVRN